MKKGIIWVRLLRPEQWTKNVFLLAPLIFSKHLFELSYVFREIQAFCAFCLASSAVYIVNDIADREYDVLHPVKRYRPIASGAVPVALARVITVLIFAGALLLAYMVNRNLLLTILAYCTLNLWYSFQLKHIVLVDVFIIASGFMLRVLAGAYAIEVEISHWLVLCTLFLSLFLAISKRRNEILLIAETNNTQSRAVLKFYSVEFLDQLMTVGAAGVVISYALYTVAERTIHVFGTENLIFTTIFVLFGIFRYIYLMRTLKLEDNPMRIILSDIPLLINMGLWFLISILIIYFNRF